MPVKKRKPKTRIPQITPAALEAFKRMEAAKTDDEWWAAHSILHKELGLPPWEWPAFEIPGAECPYPAGSHPAQHWADTRARRPQAFELYRALARSAQRLKDSD
jgi:hypothetical protein